MSFIVTWKDSRGQIVYQKLSTESLEEAKKIMRRKGVSPRDCKFEEANEIKNAINGIKDEQSYGRMPTQEPAFWEKCKAEFNAAEVKQEHRQQQEQEARDPGNFYKILTSDDLSDNVCSDIQYEYKHLRLDYKGRGITQELHLLDIDGVRVTGWPAGNNVPSLPENFQTLGNTGWQMISHQINQDLQQNGVTFHYYNFMRLKKADQPEREFSAARDEKNLATTIIESFGA